MDIHLYTDPSEAQLAHIKEWLKAEKGGGKSEIGMYTHWKIIANSYEAKNLLVFSTTFLPESFLVFKEYSNSISIEIFAVDPKSRKKGIGSAAISKAIQYFQGKLFPEIGLCSVSPNSDNFWTRCGFQAYQNVEDCEGHNYFKYKYSVIRIK